MAKFSSRPGFEVASVPSAKMNWGGAFLSPRRLLFRIHKESASANFIQAEPAADQCWACWFYTGGKKRAAIGVAELEVMTSFEAFQR